jgi:hypothetical protein
MLGLNEWSNTIMKNHKDSNHPIHKLAFIADIGMNSNDIGVKDILDKVYSHQSKEGVFQVLANIPVHFGGSGENAYTWMLCDAPLVLYSIAKMDISRHEEVITATKHLVSLQNSNGWGCTVSNDLGKFRGPGKKSDPCPYANLLMLKLIAALDTNEFDEAADIGIKAILELWDCMY